MTLYKNQLATLVPIMDFFEEMDTNLAYNAVKALFEYEPNFNSYEDYAVFFIDTDENNIDVWGITKILDDWQPVEISNRIRKFTKERVYPKDSYAFIFFD